jgi:hypothetical protein
VCHLYSHASFHGLAEVNTRLRCDTRGSCVHVTWVTPAPVHDLGPVILSSGKLCFLQMRVDIPLRKMQRSGCSRRL